MNSRWIPPILGAAALISVTGLLWMENAQLASAVERLGARIEAGPAPVREPPADPAVRHDLYSLQRCVDHLLTRLENLEQPRRISGPTSVAAGSAVAATAATDSALQATPTDSVPETTVDEFAALLAEVLGSDYSMHGTSEQQERFWELARTSKALPAMIDSLLAGIEANPGNLEARLQLADAYIAKLLTVPIGPERGVWGERAETQWKEVLDRNPQNLAAQSKIAVSLSYYPEFLHRTDDAIAALERARELQRGRNPEPDHEETYVRLAEMYVRKKQPQQAKQTLEEGLRRHPESSKLQQALTALDER
jgi:tetratricopeptide (TPR) repeat protein